MKLFLLAALLVAPGFAFAQEASGCGAFKWPVARETAALAQAHAAVETGGALEVGTPVVARLAPGDAVSFARAPERAPAPGAFGAVLKLSPEAGVYTIGLSAPAWIDVVQDGESVKPLAFSGARDCPNIRKVLKYELAGKPVTVQISNAKDASVAIVILPGAH